MSRPHDPDGLALTAPEFPGVNRMASFPPRVGVSTKVLALDPMRVYQFVLSKASSEDESYALYFTSDSPDAVANGTAEWGEPVAVEMDEMNKSAGWGGKYTAVRMTLTTASLASDDPAVTRVLGGRVQMRAVDLGRLEDGATGQGDEIGGGSSGGGSNEGAAFIDNIYTGNHSSLGVYFTETVEPMGAVGGNGWTLTVDGENWPIASVVSEEGEYVEISFNDGPIPRGSVATLSYVPPGANAIVLTTSGPLGGITDFPVPIPPAGMYPVDVFAATFPSPDMVQIQFSEPVKGALPASPAGFSVKANGSNLPITAVALGTVAETNDTIRLTVNRNLIGNDILTVSYTPGTIAGASDALLAGFVDHEVVNSLPVM